MKIHNIGSAMFQLAPIAAAPAVSTNVKFWEDYQFKDTKEIVLLVEEAADLIQLKGEAAFDDFRFPDSRWCKGETYIFVLDTSGNMIVHPDPEMEGKNHFDLKDVNGKFVVRGLIGTATALSKKPSGWYHYQWPVPGALLPRWKSSYVKLVKQHPNKSYIVGSGMYNDRMEREFVVDMVNEALGQIEKNKDTAFRLFRDVTSSFIAKDAYIFVIDPDGEELVNPAFPNLEGRNILDVKDTNGKQLVREMLGIVKTSDSGWVDYMWPKPGESVSTQKSAYVSRININGGWILVGCGVYLSDAPKSVPAFKKMTAQELVTLVHEAAEVFEKEGEKAYKEFFTKGTKWYRDETYFFVWTMNGIRAFNGPEPEKEGADLSGSKDIIGRPIGKMLIDAGKSLSGEGWIHYMYPVPGDLFPRWKSSFVRRVSFPSGINHIIGCGIYNMDLDKTFIEDLVNRAATLVEKMGKNSFVQLRDKTGPFFFMDTYVFVQSPDGIELVNPAQPVLEGRNLMNMKDLRGRPIIREEIDIAMKESSAWVELYWYKPGDNIPALKQTYLRKVLSSDGQTYIVGSGLYVSGSKGVQKMEWKSIKAENLNDALSRKVVYAKNGTMAKFFAKKGANVQRHFHDNEEYVFMISGTLKFIFDDCEVVLSEGESLIVPPNVPHSIDTIMDSDFVEFFSPTREDWLRGEDKYLRV